MLVMGALVAVAAPQFLTTDNLSNVAVLASITAIAAIGQALVVITRNIDLSVESVMGLVAYGVAITLETHTLDASGAIVMGVLLGLGLGMVNGVLVAVLRVPSIVATLGTLSIFRGIDYLIAGSHQVPLASLPPGFTDAAHGTFLGLPIFVDIAIVVALIATVILRWTRFGRQVYAVGSNPEAAAILGIPSRLVVFVAFAVCGMLAGVAGILWVVEFGTINGTSANGVVLAVVAAVVVGGVNIFGGSGHRDRGGHRRALPGLRRQCPHPRRAVAVLAAGDLRRRDPRRRQRRRPDRATAAAPRGRASRPMTGSAVPAPARPARSFRGLLRWETLLVVALIGLIVLGNALSPFFLTSGNFGNLLSALMEVAIMALPMTLVIIAGEIDLSVESMAGLASASLGFLWAAGVPIWLGVIVVLGIGALGGLLNGVLVARGGLPSLVVTLGTLALFRGLALIILGPKGVSNFPPEFTAIGFGHVPGTDIPWPFVIFLTLAVILGRRAPPDVDRASGLHDRQERRDRALLRRAGPPRQDGPLHADRGDRGPGRRHPHVPSLERPGRRRAGDDPDRGHRGPARRRQHLRWLGDHPRRRAGRPHRGGHAERATTRERVGRGPEHRAGPAADPLGRHPILCSPGQVGHRPGPPRSAAADRPGLAW